MGQISEIIEITSFDEYKFKGKLTVPQNVDVQKLVIYINGSGTNTYDNKRNGFNYFDLFADEFLKRDIAFFSYNTRGCNIGENQPMYVDINYDEYKSYLPLNSVEDIYHMIKTIKAKKYLTKLQKFKGIITPDFSLYRNMPLVMQQWNTYRGRALAVWLQNNGVEIIPNIRWNDERTYEFCFCGTLKNSTVAVGTHGCIKLKEDKEYFKKGLSELVQKLTPKTILVYGACPDNIFKKYIDMGINIIPFESEFSKSRKRVTA